MLKTYNLSLKNPMLIFLKVEFLSMMGFGVMIHTSLKSITQKNTLLGLIKI
ncbi:uncharacterized protein METZ01_LOCUS234198 [marine metagenome]|uniref:Uncharacterized protein n=1 Tax=marine metagenome TaxID=408172 RepID=A0A382H293_9ZZZZ